MKIKRAYAASVAVAALVLPLVACGNPGDAPATKQRTDLFDELPASVQKSGTLRMAILADYPPATYREENGALAGYEIEFGEALGDALGVNVEFEAAAFATVLTGIQAGRYDTALSSMADLPEREASAIFVNYLKSGVAVVVPVDNPKTVTESMNSLCGLTVAATRGTLQVELMEEFSDTNCGPNPIRTPLLDSPAEAITQVQTSRADAYMADAVVAQHLADHAQGTSGTELTVVPLPEISLPPAGMPVKLGNDELAHVLVKAWDRLITTGLYAEILQKWGVEILAVEKATINAGASFAN